MMRNKSSDCMLLVMLAFTILFFVGFKLMLSNHLDELNEYRMENRFEEIIEIVPSCYETYA